MRLKESTVFDRSAFEAFSLGRFESIPHVLRNIKTFSQRDLPTFKTREALDWLVKHE